MSNKTTYQGKIDKLITELSLEEKLQVITGGTLFKTGGLEAHGIPVTYMLDGGTGANYMQMFLDCFSRMNHMTPDEVFAPADPQEAAKINHPKRSQLVSFLDAMTDESLAAAQDENFIRELEDYRKTMRREYTPDGKMPGCFPPGIVLGATWNKDCVYHCGRALGKEANFYGVDMLLGTPNVNIHRDPRNGRLFEGYSEDPYLAASLAPSLVRGVQEMGVIANVKHFAANSQETERRDINERIPERALREIYFPAFKACVQEANCRSVMSAYNWINGVACAQNKWLLTDVLRGEWGFDGFVICDFGAAYDQVKSLLAGNDLNMPGPCNVDEVIEAVHNGTLDEAVIDEAFRRFVGVVLQMPAKENRNTEVLDREYSRKAAYEAAKEGIVLLKNQNQTLPLRKDSHVTFFGTRSKSMIYAGIGSANVITDQATNVYDCTCDIIGAEHVRYEQIVPETDAVIITIGVLGQEGFDRADLSVDFAERQMLAESIKAAKANQKKVIVILNICGPVEVEDFIDDVDAMICVFIPGMEGGRAAADAIFGRINPSGKLPITFPKRYRDCPSCGNFPGHGSNVYYGEGIFVGYRYYDYRGIEPRFPFGFGLSYSTFEITNIRLSSQQMDLDAADTIRVFADVKNTGTMAGKEVVQMYLGQRNPTLVKPEKELKGFHKVFLQPGETKTVEFEISANLLKSFDDGLHQWIAEPDFYDVYIGNSSRNTQCVSFEATGYNPNGFNAETRMDRIVATPGALETLLKFCPEGSVDRRTIEMSVMLANTESLGVMWEQRIAPSIKLPAEEKSRLAKGMLKEMNHFR